MNPPLNSFPASVAKPTQFSHLPQEIRDLIWKNALDSIGSRIIALQESLWWNRTNRIPALLHACRDSRTVALKRYQLITTEKRPEDQDPDSNRVNQRMRLNLNCFVDYETDIFMICSQRVSHCKPDISIPRPTILHLLEPARRLLTLTSLFSGFCPHRNRSCEYTNFCSKMHAYTEAGITKELFVLQVRVDSIRTDISEFIFQEDFAETMEQHGMGWMMKCQGRNVEDWHQGGVKCCDDCKQEFSDRYPAIQVLDFEAHQRSKASTTEGPESAEDPFKRF
ncbi:hypothetical protein BDZ45DRAFT_696519 [Acephala macrosclerotiorum]|nr:hypothetical protein BDZ45DRAFT_696519 [Acephala macrosclerotiorum]